MDSIKTQRRMARKVLVAVTTGLFSMVVAMGAGTAAAQTDPYATPTDDVSPTLITAPAEPEPEPEPDDLDDGDAVLGTVEETRPAGTLPFTGADLALFLVIGGGAVCTGTVLVRRSKKGSQS